MQNQKPREGEEDPVLVEEIRVARQNIGKYTRKISHEYEEECAVRMEENRQALISLLNVVNQMRYKDIRHKIIYQHYYLILFIYLYVNILYKHIFNKYKH